jgi:peptidoglycan DL-endopeptidase CwlO
VLTAGAIALAAVTPALEPVEKAVAVQAAPPAPVSEDRIRPETARLDPESAFATRAVMARRASRATIRPSVTRPRVTSASRRPASFVGRVRAAEPRSAEPRATEPRSTEPRSTARSSRVTQREPRATRSIRQRSARRLATRVRTVVTRHSATPRKQQRVMRLGNMTAVIAYAREQVGRRYVSGGEGASGFDCSGLTRAAYARAGIRLPHSSGAQAARARRISRSQARPGDLVVGPGHVGIYMGNGMMIDAGNRRTGVVYRKLYSGLSVERL